MTHDIHEINEALAPQLSETELRGLFQAFLSLPQSDRKGLDAQAVADCYDQIRASLRGRHQLLVMLSIAGQPDHLHEFVERLVTDPPGDWPDVSYAISPLMRTRDWDVDTVFPRLLDGLSAPSVAAAALDLANFVTREGMIDRHPAADRTRALSILLGNVAGRLLRLEKSPQDFGDTVVKIQSVLGEGIALAVSLCDALGLIGDQSSIGKLNQALEIGHRRVQTEAAGALARLGDEPGKQRLLELAAEPSARLRVLAYAEELGFLDQVPEEYQTDEAKAVSELAMWLSQPFQVGLPPAELEVIDHRRQYWPSFTEPVETYLIRYVYRVGDQRMLSNIGIVGPVTHAFSWDLGNLPISDIYAAFAGWHAEHAEIFEVPVAHWNAGQQRAGRELARYVERDGFDEVRPEFLGIMLDEHALVGRALRDQKPCVFATDGLEIVAYPTSSHPSSLQAPDIWSIFKGRRMLRAFNP